jgi:hypothetical protein
MRMMKSLRSPDFSQIVLLLSLSAVVILTAGPATADWCCTSEEEKFDGYPGQPRGSMRASQWVLTQSFRPRHDFTLCKVSLGLVPAYSDTVLLRLDIQDGPGSSAHSYTHAFMVRVITEGWYTFDIRDMEVTADTDYFIRLTGLVGWRHQQDVEGGSDPYPRGKMYWDLQSSEESDRWFRTYSYEYCRIYADTAYGWEDFKTVLGLRGRGYPPILATNVSAPDPVHSGLRSLRLEDNCPTKTPWAYIAWVTGLVEGDSVYAEFWRYDTSPWTVPSCDIWAHWNDTDSLDGYSGDAGGSGHYGPGTGRDRASHVWHVSDGHTGLVVACRTYSSPGDVVWIDDLTIHAPAQAIVYTPSAGPSAVKPTTWSSIKAAYR